MGKFKVGDRVVQDKTENCTDLVRHWNTYWKRTEGELIGEEFVVTRASDFGVSYSNRIDGRGPAIENKFLKLAPLKIESGKFYKTREGLKVGPMAWNDGRWFVRGALGTWNHDGTASQHHKPTATDFGNLIAEWVDKPAVAVANDNATKAKFKVGDRVRANRCEPAGIGIIEAVNDNGTYRVNFKDTWYGVCTEKESSISLKSAPTQPTAIVALIESGQPKPATRPFVHTTVEAATKESDRLAGVHKGKEFGVYVLQSTAKHEKPAVTYKHKWQRLAANGEKINAIKELRALTGMQLKPAKDVVEHFVDCPYGAAA